MKTQKYLVTIEMPDGDMIGPGWIKDIIQADCDVEDAGRQKVSVEEIKAEESPRKTLDEAAHSYAWEKQEHHIEFDGDEYFDYGPRYDAFKAGAKWQEEKDQEIIKLAEDHAFLAGADWQKEQMMKEAVEEVVKYNDYPEYKYVLVPHEEFNDGDKVRIIIVKEG